MARAMERQTARLLGRLGRTEPHVGSGDCLEIASALVTQHPKSSAIHKIAGTDYPIC